MEKADLSELLWEEMEQSFNEGDETSALEHLKAGFPIYYIEPDTPKGLQIKEYPDGRKELVRLNFSGEDEVIELL